MSKIEVSSNFLIWVVLFYEFLVVIFDELDLFNLSSNKVSFQRICNVGIAHLLITGSSFCWAVFLNF